jgi:hypothetical protein
MFGRQRELGRGPVYTSLACAVRDVEEFGVSNHTMHMTAGRSVTSACFDYGDDYVFKCSMQAKSP